MIKRNDMYVNIDCFEEKEQKVYFKPICCKQVVDGCDITTCGCDPKYSVRVQVLDKGGNIVSQSSFKNNVSRIIIDKDALGHVLIKVE